MRETHVSVGTKHCVCVCVGSARGEGLSAPIGMHVFGPH